MPNQVDLPHSSPHGVFRTSSTCHRPLPFIPLALLGLHRMPHIARGGVVSRVLVLRAMVMALVRGNMDRRSKNWPFNIDIRNASRDS